MPWAVAILARWATANQMELDKKFVGLRKESIELEKEFMELEKKSNKSSQKSLVFSGKANDVRNLMIDYDPEG